VLPYGTGDAMLWQAVSGMYFSMAEAWTGPVPASFRAWPIVETFKHGGAIANEGPQLDAFLGAHRASAILIEENYPRAGAWRALLQSRGAQIEEVGGVIIARPRPPLAPPASGP
jgi:hypothetical protein